jgi:hypothetical protein
VSLGGTGGRARLSRMADARLTCARLRPGLWPRRRHGWPLKRGPRGKGAQFPRCPRNCDRGASGHEATVPQGAGRRPGASIREPGDLPAMVVRAGGRGVPKASGARQFRPGFRHERLRT